jgi:hypothetical protein
VSARPRRVGTSALAALALGGLVSCHDLSRFDTEGAAAYCGAIVGLPPFNSGFVPSGAPPNLSLRLRLDTSTLTTRPGSLTSNDATSGFCEPAPLFDEAPLRAIPAILHDALSQADLGEGRQHTFFAWVDSTCGTSMVAVISLLTNCAVGSAPAATRARSAADGRRRRRRCRVRALLPAAQRNGLRLLAGHRKTPC